MKFAAIVDRSLVQELRRGAEAIEDFARDAAQYARVAEGIFDANRVHQISASHEAVKSALAEYQAAPQHQATSDALDVHETMQSLGAHLNEIEASYQSVLAHVPLSERGKAIGPLDIDIDIDVIGQSSLSELRRSMEELRELVQKATLQNVAIGALSDAPKDDRRQFRRFEPSSIGSAAAAPIGTDPLTEERAARVLLDKYWDSTIPVDPEHIAREMGAQVVYDADGGSSGDISFDDGEVVIRINGHKSEVRRRFTIAHEIGHWVFEHGNSHRDDTTTISDPDCDLPESRANRFAACLLMPADPLAGLACEGRHSVEYLAEIFKVHPNAMAARLKQLRIVK